MSGGGSSVREPDANRPGSVLRAEREALGVTVREVAETLNLSMTVIEAIAWIIGVRVCAGSTAVPMRIPGTPASAAYVEDAYRMTAKGPAAREAR